MYQYNTKKASSVSAVFFIVLFILVFIGCGWLLFIDKSKFWDFLPIIAIISSLINLILLIFYFSRRSFFGYFFTLFFIIFLAGIILSSFFGPFKVYKDAMSYYENKEYTNAATNFKTIIENYPNSRYIEDATKYLADSYYLNGSYENAISYFKIAVSKKYIDEQNLEIKRIFAECYYKLAEENYKNKKYLDASSNFLNSISYFSEISKNFPDTNEAFIAKYKIPELLFKTALSYKNSQKWEDAVKTLQKLKEEYPDSEYIKEGESLLYDIYILKASDLKKNNKIKESILEFLKIFTLDMDKINLSKYQIDYQTNFFMQDAKEADLSAAANQLFVQGQYSQALFLFEYIYKNFPESAEEITKNYVECKFKVLSKSNLADFESISQSKPIGSFKKEGFSKVLFENKTDFILNIFIKGQDYKVLNLDKQSKAELELISGNYEILVESKENLAKPFYGEVTYEDGSRYREIFKIETKQ